MSRQRIILILGIWVAVLPFLGFPGSWKRILFLVCGAVIAFLAYLISKERRNNSGGGKKDDQMFVDNRDEVFSEDQSVL